MKRKNFLLRVEPELHAALNRWAVDELRSVNAQIEFILRRALQQAGRYPSAEDEIAGSAKAAKEKGSP